MEQIIDFTVAVFNEGEYILNYFFPSILISKLQFDNYGKLLKLTDELIKIYVVYLFVLKISLEGLFLNITDYIKNSNEVEYSFINKILISLVYCAFSKWSDGIIKSNPSNQSHLSPNLRTKPAAALVIDKNQLKSNKQRVLFKDENWFVDMIDIDEFQDFFNSKYKDDLYKLFDTLAQTYLNVFKKNYDSYNERMKTLKNMQKQNVYHKQTKGGRR